MNGAFLEPSGMREYMKKKTTETSSRYMEKESQFKHKDGEDIKLVTEDTDIH